MNFFVSDNLETITNIKKISEGYILKFKNSKFYYYQKNINRGTKKMVENKITISFVINGKEYPVEVNINSIVKEGVTKALKDAGIGGSPSDWKIKKEDGSDISLDKSWEEQGIIQDIKLFLTKGAGRGGYKLKFLI